MIPPPTAAAPVLVSIPRDLRTVPAKIDGVYLQAVVDALDHADGEAWRLVQAEGALTPEAVAMNEALHTPHDIAPMQTLAHLLTVDPSTLIRPAGDRVSTIERVVVARQDCVSMIVLRDNRALRPSLAPHRAGVRLVPSSGDRRNPTAYETDEDFVMESAESDRLVAELCD